MIFIDFAVYIWPLQEPKITFFIKCFLAQIFDRRLVLIEICTAFATLETILFVSVL